MSMTIYTNTKPVPFNARTASTVWKNLFLGALIALFAIVGIASVSLSAAPAFAQEVEVADISAVNCSQNQVIQVVNDVGQGMSVIELDINADATNATANQMFTQSFDGLGIVEINGVGLNPVDGKLYGSAKMDDDSAYIVRFGPEGLEFVHEMHFSFIADFDSNGTYFYVRQGQQALYYIENLAEKEGRTTAEASLTHNFETMWSVNAGGKHGWDIVVAEYNGSKYIISAKTGKVVITNINGGASVEYAAPGLPSSQGYGGAYLFGDKMYVSANDGQGIFEIFWKDFIDNGSGLVAEVVDNSVVTLNNDGANCKNIEIVTQCPFAGLDNLMSNDPLCVEPAPVATTAQLIIDCASLEAGTPRVEVSVGNQDVRVWVYNKTGDLNNGGDALGFDNSDGYFNTLYGDTSGIYNFSSSDYLTTQNVDLSPMFTDLEAGDSYALKVRFVNPADTSELRHDELRLVTEMPNCSVAPCAFDAELLETDADCAPVTTFEQSYSFDCATGPQWVVTNTGNEDRTVILQQQIGELNGTPQYATVSSTTVPAGEEVTLDFADAVPAEDTTETFVINTFSANSAPTYITQDVSVDCEYAYPSIEISPDCGGLEIMQFANAGTADMLVEMIVNGEVVDSFTMASMDFREYSIAPYLVEDVEVTLEYRVTSLDTVIQDVVFSGLRDCEEPVCEFDSSLVASDKDCVEETLITDENEEDTTPEPEEEKEESEEDTPEEEVIPEPEEENTDEEEVIEEINTTDGAEEEAPVEEEDESELALTGGFHKQMIAYAGVFLATGFLLFLIGRRKREDDIVLWSHSGSIRVN